ncbi:para-aminobenzoate synthase, subunit I [Luminiphilus syltensis NOR5-1B]|uniref:Para-aminobenzoate synthase, subunit I n=1 Tax=Luminiphilus syltensis NOR5-1B TaxID=565045 RepID=B8KRN1_9GAMM|nr:anthranilate synthase component I family protein [Luminiphilus syltensis]EED35646.1 para-aminobenzoate synthase, subunit I [Luminiphilus syltensis NOR5-1B]
MNSSTFPLIYQPSIDAYGARLRHLPGFALLDSSGRRGSVGRYDVLTALPAYTFSVADYNNDPVSWISAIEQQLSLEAVANKNQDNTELMPYAPPCVIGHLDYDTAASQQGIADQASARGSAGLYRWLLVQDHVQQRTWVTFSDGATPEQRNDILGLIKGPDEQLNRSNKFVLKQDFKATTSKTGYRKCIDRIQHYIVAGDCYQVNFAHRFHAPYEGDTWVAWKKLKAAAGGNFAAYLRPAPDHTVLSLSPERFLAISGGQVITQPIKGTEPRHTDPEIDARNAERLAASSKDRAENVMITDLLRNDIGKYCQAGSVRVPELCALHTYSNVHHLVSTVTGVLKPGVSSGQILVGCSPGGSITGAPKKRSMEIIRELETGPRGAYCGSIFVLGADGSLQSNIAIRTLEALSGELVCWGGGGITAGSHWEAEYQETLDKVGVFMHALERQ